MKDNTEIGLDIRFNAKKAKADQDRRIEEMAKKRAEELRTQAKIEETRRLEKENPEWYQEYLKKINNNRVDLLDLVRRLSSMQMDDISSEMNGNVEDLGYELLSTLFSEGSTDERMAAVLTRKRGEYVKKHPELVGKSEGIITFDGRVISMEDWNTATDSEKRAILVGSTCFHYNSGTPGMDSSPKDRW